MLLTDALDDYLVQLEANGRSHHTVGQARRHIGLLARWRGSATELKGIDHLVLARFLSSPEAKLRPDGKAKKGTAMNTMRSSLRAFFAYLCDAGFMRENPARLIRRAMCSPPPPRALSEDEQARLIAVLKAGKGRESERDYLLFALMLHSGLRIGSALALAAEDVDLERATLRIRQSKGNRPDTVVLGKEALRLLVPYLRMNPAGPLFPGPGGRAITPRHAQRRFRAWAKAAGICGGVSTHSLRHSFATGLYRRTADLGLVQRALGHRSIASTLIYARCSDEQLRAVLGA